MFYKYEHESIQLISEYKIIKNLEEKVTKIYSVDIERRPIKSLYRR